MLIKRTHHRCRITMNERIPLRGALLAAVAVVLVAATSTALAAEESSDAIDRADIEASYSEIDGMIADLQAALVSAESALSEVKSMKVEDSNRMVNEFFQEMKDKVNLMLERLGPNSVLMDNLEGAKANVIVFKRWFERQPADFPNRDRQIVQLEQMLQEYDSLANEIIKGRQHARKALTELSRSHFIQVMELKVKSVEQSVEMTKRVLASLQSLGAGIRKIAEQEVPNVIPD